jgi:hypothetical protein
VTNLNATSEPPQAENAKRPPANFHDAQEGDGRCDGCCNETRLDVVKEFRHTLTRSSFFTAAWDYNDLTAVEAWATADFEIGVRAT